MNNFKNNLLIVENNLKMLRSYVFDNFRLKFFEKFHTNIHTIG